MNKTRTLTPKTSRLASAAMATDLLGALGITFSDRFLAAERERLTTDMDVVVWTEGNPLVTIDLKWSLWSASRDHWREYAPNTLAMLVQGFDEGHLFEYGGTIVIRTLPRKEIRRGRVTITATQTAVQFTQEYDDDSIDEETATFPTPESLDDLLATVDAVEERLIAKRQ